MSKFFVKFKIALKQNLIAFLLVFSWFFGNFLFLLFWTPQSIIRILSLLFLLRSDPGQWCVFYQTYTELVIFGLVVGVITVDLFHKFKPEEACEKIAAKQEDHNLIVGWSHIGQRVWNYLRKKGESCVLLEKDPQKVEHLVNEEEPVITSSPVEMENLKKANIRKAKRVFVLVGDLVTETTVSHHTRSLNNTCELICRIFHDKVAEVLKKLITLIMLFLPQNMLLKTSLKK
ncbi:MAG: hypothetical protein GWO20_18930 [Candidatus Korarchaeota archaeon]|nr:hypothetical protein [Candidatus Korarchaeota archaeon]NIU85337.1 hypothetical protein [Candidatus Thorarchaeota archaeon]NIW15427.1 hypothetical protein [Candidatus Thorarchaeota archaeon]NIW53373.1 hypothetical protein [Candidatus Korarchaeota archaeon]